MKSLRQICPTNMEIADYFFNADYRKFNFVSDSMEYWEVTKDGKLVNHDSLDWKIIGYTIDNKGKLIKF